MQQNGSRPPTDVDGLDYFIGENVWIPEALVVSPSPGRFRREPLLEGSAISIGTAIGRVAFNGGRSLSIESNVAGVFLGWLAWEGESLQRGTPIARIGLEATAASGEPPKTRSNGSQTTPRSERDGRDR